MQSKEVSINIDYKVLIKCMTYNHSKFIVDALNGFAMQKTDYPFVCLVVDDASTDGAQNIIKGFLEQKCNINKSEINNQGNATVTIARHKENTKCLFVCYLLTENLFKQPEKKKTLYKTWVDNAKYIALCEGDDFWIDSLKLQKQVDFLEKNNQYVMCYTGFKVVSAEKEPIKSEFAISNLKKSFSGDIFDELLKGNFIQTMTVCYRKEVEDTPIFRKCPAYMDLSLFLSLAWMGLCKFFPETTSVYRHHGNSITRSIPEYIYNRGNIIGDYFYELYRKERGDQKTFLENMDIKVNKIKDIFRLTIDNKRFNQLAKNDLSLYFFYPFGITFYLLRKIKTKLLKK
ncbi:MAG: glycosyltransferase [Bacteroidales bacterium]|nr:glycosyltransferase [Bacteroidales bacterium]